MSYEVEQKFPVPDLAALRSQLESAGAAISPSRREEDLYFAHPARDFSKTDEALRLRTVGDRHRITYKGPKIDAATKTRREIELPLAAESAAQWPELLQALGFQPVAHVRKTRSKAHLRWRDRDVEISLDEVDGVGTFVELELVCEEEELDATRARIISLAESLGLARSERRSYLELLMGGKAGSGKA